MPTYSAITDQALLRDKVQKMLEHDGPIGFDIETGYYGPPEANRALDPYRNVVVGFSFTDSKDYAFYVPIQHDLALQLDPDDAIGEIQPLLESGRIVAHNLKFEARNISTHFGIEIKARDDSMISAYATGLYPRYGLKPLVERIFGHTMTELVALFPRLKAQDKKKIRFNILDVTQETTDYACEDAAWCLALHEKHYDRVKNSLIYRVEMDCIDTSRAMEEDGLAIDWEFLNLKGDEAEKFMTLLEAEIKTDLEGMLGRPLPNDKAGKPFNLNSGAQLGQLLYGELGMSTTRKTKSGAMSTDAVAMEGLSQRFPVVQKILYRRELQALISRFLRKWPKEFDLYDDGRARASYNQVGVHTGRFAVKDPPTQQCPKKRRYTLRDESVFYLVFRDSIIAAPGYYLLDFDYRQIELCVMAGESQEPQLIRAFNEDLDIHSITAAMMLGVPLDDVIELQRAVGKTMNFALLYGMGVQSLSERLGISKDRANELYNSYFAGFPSIHTWMEKMKRKGSEDGFTLSKFGRRFTIWEFQSDNHKVRSKADRMCVNAPIQGGAADYMKVAMMRAKKTLQNHDWWRTDVKMVMNNHDALTFEVSEKIPLSEIIPVIKGAVEFPIEGWPKVTAEFSAGFRWGSMFNYQEGMTCRDGKVTLEDGTLLSDEHLKEETGEDGLSDDEETPTLDQTIPDMPEPSRVEEAALVITEPVHGIGLRVLTEHMPNQEQFLNFLNFLRDNEGPNYITLVTPQGEVLLDITSSITSEDQPRTSMILGGAEVVIEVKDVDATAVTAGLEL